MTHSAATQALGAPLATFPYDPEQRKVSLFVGLGFLGLAVAFPVLYWLDPVAVGQTVFLSPVVAIGGVLTLAHWAYTAGISLAIHQGGFVYRDQVVPFSRVRGVRYKLVHVTGGQATYNRGFFEVRLDDGSKVKPNMQLETMEKVIGQIVAHTTPMLCDGIVQAIRAGQVVRFGPFELHPQGIVCKGKSIPWERVSISTGAVDPKMILREVDPDSGDSREVHEAKIADIENADVLEAVAESLRVAAIRSRPR